MAVLLVSFLVLMVLGCPIAFCLLCSGTFYFLANDMALIMVVQRLTEGANTFTLLAVPGFILAGNLMNSGEVTDRIFDFCGKLVDCRCRWTWCNRVKSYARRRLRR